MHRKRERDEKRSTEESLCRVLGIFFDVCVKEENEKDRNERKSKTTSDRVNVRSRDAISFVMSKITSKKMSETSKHRKWKGDGFVKAVPSGDEIVLMASSKSALGPPPEIRLALDGVSSPRLGRGTNKVREKTIPQRDPLSPNYPRTCSLAIRRPCLQRAIVLTFPTASSSS